MVGIKFWKSSVINGLKPSGCLLKLHTIFLLHQLILVHHDSTEVVVYELMNFLCENMH